MLKRLTLFLILSVLILAELQAQSTTAITTFILVRHAEKGNDGTDDPDLKPEGLERTKRLVAVLKNVNVDAVYSTRFKRTKNTVTPLAQNKGLDVKVYESLNETALDEVIKDHPGGTIVIGGHSNTIPQIANLLLGKDDIQAFQDNEFGNLLIISVLERGKSAKATWLTY